jgi:CBS domain containing-hemolysin-like protein
MLSGGLEQVAAQSTAAVLVLLVLTAAQVILGELVPKSLALQHPTPSALYTFPALFVSLWVYRPFIAWLNGSGLFLLRVLRAPLQTHRHIHSPDEIELLIAESRDGGLLEHDEHERLQRALKLNLRQAKQLMVPRRRMSALDLNTPLNEVVATVASSPYSRLPVYRDSLDNVVGVLHTRDLVRWLVDGSPAASLAELIRPISGVHESVTADRVLRHYRERRSHQALVVDEFGGRRQHARRRAVRARGRGGRRVPRRSAGGRDAAGRACPAARWHGRARRRRGARNELGHGRHYRGWTGHSRPGGHAGAWRRCHGRPLPVPGGARREPCDRIRPGHARRRRIRWNDERGARTAIIAVALANALFVAAEFAIVGASRAQIDHAAAEGNRLAVRVARILESTQRQDRYIATTQIGISIASLGLGMYGENVLAAWIEPRLMPFDAYRWFAAHTAASIVAIASSPTSHRPGEVVPKALALQASADVLYVSPWSRRCRWRSPLVTMFNAGNGLLRSWA